MPTDFKVSEVKKYGSIAPIISPMITPGSTKEMTSRPAACANATIMASAVNAALPMQKPLPMAAVVLPYRIKTIGDAADFWLKFCHLCDTAGIICDRSICVYRNSDAGRRQHADRTKRDAIHAEE